MSAPTRGTILVVDDTLANRWVLVRILEEAGYAVRQGESGEDALTMATEQPDLIVLDVHLPDVSGFVVAERLKRAPETTGIPLLLISASFTSPGARAKGLDAGADGYLTHPIEPPVLVATVRALLRSRDADLALRESESRFRQMADTAPVLIWMAGIDAKCEWLNRPWLEFTGRSMEAELGDGWTEGMHPDDYDRCMQVYLGAFAQRQPFSMEYRLRRHDGEFRWLLDNGVPRFDGGGGFLGYIGTCIDITERKAAEAEREALLASEREARLEADAARIAAEQANVAKSDFLAVMSHELRTPLNAIGGYVDLLELGIRGPVTAEQLTDLDRIRRNQLHLLGLINNILNFAKLEAGHVEVHITEAPLPPILAGMEPLIEPQLRAKALAYRYEPCDPDLAVHTDVEKTQQILLNLLSNAIKFTERGGRIELTCRATTDAVEVIVRDTGCGIPPEKLDAIFEPFVQVEQRLTRQGQGTGLGLAISRDLARALDGDLVVESRLGEGATFTLKLPRA
jgi:PAS domain S-box-containing protein